MWERNLNALLIVILSGVLLAGFGVQIIKHEQPCPLCLLQRLGMIGVAIGALLNVKFGGRTGHYALSILSAIFGGFVALRQISLHICPEFPSFGTPVWGLSLYTWSFVVFACSLAYIAILLLIFDRRMENKESQMNGWCLFSSGLILLLSCANIINALILCGLSSCEG